MVDDGVGASGKQMSTPFSSGYRKRNRPTAASCNFTVCCSQTVHQNERWVFHIFPSSGVFTLNCFYPSFLQSPEGFTLDFHRYPSDAVTLDTPAVVVSTESLVERDGVLVPVQNLKRNGVGVFAHFVCHMLEELPCQTITPNTRLHEQVMKAEFPTRSKRAEATIESHSKTQCRSAVGFCQPSMQKAVVPSRLGTLSTDVGILQVFTDTGSGRAECIFHLLVLCQLTHQLDEGFGVVASSAADSDSHFKDLSLLNLFQATQ